MIGSLLPRLVGALAIAVGVVILAGCSATGGIPAGGNQQSAVTDALRVQAEANVTMASNAMQACVAEAESGALNDDLSSANPVSCDAAALARTNPQVAPLLQKGQAPGGVTVVNLATGGFQATAHAGQIDGSPPMTYSIESTPEIPIRKFCAPPDAKQCPNGQWPEI